MKSKNYQRAKSLKGVLKMKKWREYAMGRRGWHTISNFVCGECGMVMPLPRKHCYQREKGHIKDIYCPVCKDVKKFQEIGYKEFYRNMEGEIVCK